jgi:hypothetical protein
MKVIQKVCSVVFSCSHAVTNCIQQCLKLNKTFTRYDGGWPIDDMLTQYLRNRSASHRKEDHSDLEKSQNESEDSEAESESSSEDESENESEHEHESESKSEIENEGESGGEHANKHGLGMESKDKGKGKGTRMHEREHEREHKKNSGRKSEKTNRSGGGSNVRIKPNGKQSQQPSGLRGGVQKNTVRKFGQKQEKVRI